MLSIEVKFENIQWSGPPSVMPTTATVSVDGVDWEHTLENILNNGLNQLVSPDGAFFAMSADLVSLTAKN